MITSAEIKKKASRKYTDYLRDVAAGKTFQPIEIQCDKKQVIQLLNTKKNLMIFALCPKRLKVMDIQYIGRL